MYNEMREGFTMKETYLCFDLGGSSIKVALMTRNGDLEMTTSLLVPDSLDEMLETMHGLYQQHLYTHNIVGVTLSLPGAVDSKTGIIGSMSAIPYIHGPNWKALWKERYGLNISLENDANCAALGELYFGKGKDLKDFAYVVVGTGIGGALVVDGKLHHGKHNLGGEFGFMVIKQDPESIWSYEGAFGGLLYKASQLGYNITNGVELFDLASTEEPLQQLIQHFYKTTAIGLFNIHFMFDPEVIFIGGAISQRPGLVDQFNQALDVFASHPMITTRPVIEVGSLKQHANLYGALANYLIEYEGLTKGTS